MGSDENMIEKQIHSKNQLSISSTAAWHRYSFAKNHKAKRKAVQNTFV